VDDPFTNFNDLVKIDQVMKGGELISTGQVVSSYPSGTTATPAALSVHSPSDWLATGLALRSAGCCSVPSPIAHARR
jgi:hypothetical protein